MKKFNHILWKNTPVVKGLFSLKNPDFRSDRIPAGLNLGYNTIEEDGITRENMKMWLEFAGAVPHKIATGKQVHGNRVELVQYPGIYEDTDGLVTDVPGMSLGIFVADCGGILISDEEAGIIGACHAGWRGAVSGIIPNTLAAMQNMGARLNKTDAFISPCISMVNFEVGEQVASQFPVEFVDRSNPKPYVDLPGFIKQQMMDCGIAPGKITSAEGCTMAEPDLFYSYRREKSNSGRMMALITLKDSA